MKPSRATAVWLAVLHGSSTTWFHVRFVTNNISLTSNLYSYNQTMGNSKFNVSTPVDHFFPDFLRAQNVVRVIKGKIT